MTPCHPYYSPLLLKCSLVKFVKRKEEEVKLSLFSDDMTCFLRDTTSYHLLVATLESFSRFSNLQVNKDKTEIFAIGSHRLDQNNYAHKVRTSIKILGIVLTLTSHRG